MTIGEIITLHYDELQECCSCDKIVSLGRTECDILQNVCYTALKKFKDKDITEEEGFEYLKKNLYAELHFQYARKSKEIVSYVGDLRDFRI